MNLTRSKLFGLVILLIPAIANARGAKQVDSAPVGHPSHWTPLQVAASEGDIKMVRKLLEDPKTDVSFKNKDGATALYIAVSMGHSDAVSVLLKEGKADPSLQCQGFYPLQLAASEGRSLAIQALLADTRTDVNCRHHDGSTPLFYAVQQGKLDAASILLKEGKADPNLPMNNGWSPLHQAANKGDTEMVDLLLQHGANVNAMDCKSRTPLAVAAPQDKAGASYALRKRGGVIVSPHFVFERAALAFIKTSGLIRASRYQLLELGGYFERLSVRGLSEHRNLAYIFYLGARAKESYAGALKTINLLHPDIAELLPEDIRQHAKAISSGNSQTEDTSNYPVPAKTIGHILLQIAAACGDQEAAQEAEATESASESKDFKLSSSSVSDSLKLLLNADSYLLGDQKLGIQKNASIGLYYYQQHDRLVYSSVLGKNLPPLSEPLIPDPTKESETKETKGTSSDCVYAWPKQQGQDSVILRIRFLNGSPELQQYTRNIIEQAWAEAAAPGLKFHFCDTKDRNPADVRIQFDVELKGDSGQAIMGQFARYMQMSQREPTFKISSRYTNQSIKSGIHAERFWHTIVHEFGHVLGLDHTHLLYPEVLTRFFDEVFPDHNTHSILRSYGQFCPFSVMSNVFESAHARDGIPIPRTYMPSQADLRAVKAMYNSHSQAECLFKNGALEKWSSCPSRGPVDHFTYWEAAGGDSVQQFFAGDKCMSHQRYEDAAQWLQMAADQKQPLAMLLLSRIYKHGLGVKEDPQRAQDLVREVKGILRGRSLSDAGVCRGCAKETTASYEKHFADELGIKSGSVVSTTTTTATIFAYVLKTLGYLYE